MHWLLLLSGFMESSKVFELANHKDNGFFKGAGARLLIVLSIKQAVAGICTVIITSLHAFNDLIFLWKEL